VRALVLGPLRITYLFYQLFHGLVFLSGPLYKYVSFVRFVWTFLLGDLHFGACLCL
jgi:hypothetical protein